MSVKPGRGVQSYAWLVEVVEGKHVFVIFGGRGAGLYMDGGGSRTETRLDEGWERGTGLHMVMVGGGSRREKRLCDGWERGAGLYMVGGGSKSKTRVGEGCEKGAGLYMVGEGSMKWKHVFLKAG